MPEKGAASQRKFIGKQRKRLEALRRQILGSEQRTLSEERTFREEQGEDAGDVADKAQPAVEREVAQALHDTDAQRLRNIDRALQKIAEGTYGFSDRSGAAIPKARLEATPEAILTFEEAKGE